MNGKDILAQAQHGQPPSPVFWSGITRSVRLGFEHLANPSCALGYNMVRRRFDWGVCGETRDALHAVACNGFAEEGFLESVVESGLG